MSLAARLIRVVRLIAVLAVIVLTLPSVAAAAPSGRAWSQGTQTDRYDASFGAGGALASISCPAATQCTAVDDAGNEITYNPSGTNVPSPVNVLAFTGGSGIVGVDAMFISCPSVSQCTAVSDSGYEVTFDPADPGAAKAVRLSLEGGFSGVDCPSTSVCVAVSGEDVFDFDAASPGSAQVVAVTGLSTELDAISCLSAASCTVIDSEGRAATFNPADPGSPSAASVGLPATVGLSCVSGTCVTVSYDGKEASFPATAPGLASTASIDTSDVDAVSCASSTQCVAVDGGGQVTAFNPSSVGTPVPATVDGAITIDAVLCRSASACTAVDRSGGAVAFNPASPSTATRTVIDADAPTDAISCPAEDQCTEMDGAGAEVTFDPTAATPTDITRAVVDPAPGAQISCPSTTQCTTYDDDGYEVTFNPQHPSGLHDALLDSHPYGAESISCPSTTQCTATDFSGWITFNPQNPGNPPVDSSADFNVGMACPSATQCTVMENNGYELTFNPQSPSATIDRFLVDANGYSAGIVCPSVNQCTTVDTVGAEVTFNPNDPGMSTPQTIDTVYVDGLDSTHMTVDDNPEPGILVSISCPTTTDCVAVDAQGDALEGDPTRTGAWVSIRPSETAGLTAVACPDLAICVVADDSGFASVGRLAPVSTGSPYIAGTPVAGDTLTESHGNWSSPPMSYTYQWLDCDVNGQDCAAIADATSQSYVLSAADIGHTVEVEETATNPGGTSGPASSARTALVTNAPPAQTSPPQTTTAPTTTTTTTPTATVPGAQGPSRALILADLRHALGELTGKNARLSVILTHRGFIYVVRIPSAGVLKLSWTVTAHHHTTVLAGVSATFLRARSATVRIKLTKAGLKLVGRPELRSLRLTEAASFTPRGASAVEAVRTVTLKRG